MNDRFDHTLEHTLKSKPGDDGDADPVKTVRRLEMITGTGRRRRWSEAEKARIVMESLEPGANVSEVARRHGVSPQQLFGWRRQARALFDENTTRKPLVPPEKVPQRVPGTSARETVSAFASVVVAANPKVEGADTGAPPPPRVDTLGRIEIVIGDTIVRVFGQVESATLTPVLRAVRRA